MMPVLLIVRQRSLARKGSKALITAAASAKWSCPPRRVSRTGGDPARIAGGNQPSSHLAAELKTH